MDVPKFALRKLTTHSCECGYRLRKPESAIVGGGLRKRRSQPKVDFTVEIECPACGRSSFLILDAAGIDWDETLKWATQIAANRGQMGSETEGDNSLITDIPALQIEAYVKTGPKKYLQLHMIGGYKRGNVRMILFRRVAQQQDGWDGQSYDDILRLDKNDKASFPEPTAEEYLPHVDWHRFYDMAPLTKFRLGNRDVDEDVHSGIGEVDGSADNFFCVSNGDRFRPRFRPQLPVTNRH